MNIDTKAHKQNFSKLNCHNKYNKYDLFKECKFYSKTD